MMSAVLRRNSGIVTATGIAANGYSPFCRADILQQMCDDIRHILEGAMGDGITN